jgi:hypothetical protein
MTLDRALDFENEKLSALRTRLENEHEGDTDGQS